VEYGALILLYVIRILLFAFTNQLRQIVPTSVLLNWEMEFKKFLPGFKIMSYHGTTKRRKELRQGWYNKHQFNVCITSYTLASRDAHIFKRKAWYYMILDEAHMIKNFKSQRWNILLMFRSFRRLLLTGTPLQNNLTELWALLQFLMSGANFANLKEFGEWFSSAHTCFFGVMYHCLLLIRRSFGESD
jgi:helicase SWR1